MGKFPCSDSATEWLPRAHAAAIGFAVALLLPFTCTWTQEPRSTWSGVERVVAFGDVHGAAEELATLLRSVGVIDAGLRWSAGTAHVVSLGDLLDRGGESRAVMDLLIRLQDEAAAAGGAMHVVLGNHEAMNLLGDLRYVTPDEFASFAADEPSGLRDRLRGQWIEDRGADAVGEFDQRFPPGYFGHRAAFAPNGRYGRWLLGLPVAIRIDRTLFMHAGPSALVAGLSLEEVNSRYRAALTDYLTALDAAMAAGVLRFDDTFEERAARAQQRQSGSGATAAGAVAARRFQAADRNEMLDIDGPNWYRGPALCHEASESDVLHPALDVLESDQLVIGHTVAHNQRAASRFDGAVIKLDTGMNSQAYNGHPAALLIEQDEVRIVYADESAPPGDVPPEPLYVTSSTLDDAAVVEILAEGTVAVGARRGQASLDVTVELSGRSIRAQFVPAPAEAVDHELAAYRIDRALGLGLVPATARRQVEGHDGYLQARPPDFVSQAEAEAQSLQFNGWCALEPQIDLMNAFDGLIGNEARGRENMLYDSEWMLLLAEHDRAFGTGTSVPRRLRARSPRPGTEMYRRLSALDPATLDESVGDLLSDRQREALLARRDSLIEAR